MKKDQTLKLVYMALYVVLYIVLKWVGNLIPFLQMPNGGSIELELIAVFIASYHLGWLRGAGVALISWLMTWILGFPMWIYYPIQTVLDYVGPLVACGLASLLWPFKNTGKTGAVAMGILLAVGAFFGIINSYGHVMPAFLAGGVLAIGTFIFVYWYLSEKKRFGIVIAMFLKYFLQVLSGVYYWMPDGEYPGSPASWAFSLSYNLWYNLVTLIVCIFVVPVLIERLKKARVKFVA